MSIADRIAEARRSGDYGIIVRSVPYFQWMGIEIGIEDGQALCRLPYRDSLIGNPLLPALHGGVTGAFLEATAAVTLMVGRETEKFPKIINITIEYLRPGRPIDTFATGSVSRQGRRIAGVSTTAWQDDRDRPIGRAHTHFLTA